MRVWLSLMILTITGSPERTDKAIVQLQNYIQESEQLQNYIENEQGFRFSNLAAQ